MQHDGLVKTTMPQELAAHLAGRLEQRSFHCRRKAWEAALHDDQPSVELLHRLGERVDRETTRAVVLGDLTTGRVLPAFVAAMIWGYGTTGYGPARVRWVLAAHATARGWLGNEPQWIVPVKPHHSGDIGRATLSGRHTIAPTLPGEGPRCGT